jgi:polyisoprenoid-binding protein YceI
MTMRRVLVCSVVLLLAAMAPGAALAEPMKMNLHKNYSQASFKSDAPLETFVGVAGKDAVDASISFDPAQPTATSGTVKIDMNRVSTGIEKRDADMRGKPYLETDVEANRWVTFELKNIELTAPLEPGKAVPARVRGILTIKQKPVERTAEANVTYIKLTPEQVEQQKRFGFGTDNLKVKARLTTTFTEHGMQIPQLLFLKVNNELQLEADLTFVRAQ